MATTTFTGPVVSLNGFQFPSDSNKYIILSAPASLAANYTLTLPPNDGSNGQYLKTDGNGVLSWAAGDGSGTVTSVATSGTVNGLTLTGGPITTTGTVTLGGNFALVASTVAALEDVSNAINTTGKYIGKPVVVLATGLIFTATGAAAADAWKASDGTTSANPV